MPTAALRNSRLSESQLGAQVEAVLETPPPDGMAMGPNGKIYLTDVERSALNVFDPETKKLSPVIADGRLSWPDSLAWGPKGALYVTCSQIQNMPRFNNGKSLHAVPYQVFKVVGALGSEQ